MIEQDERVNFKNKSKDQTKQQSTGTKLTSPKAEAQSSGPLLIGNIGEGFILLSGRQLATAQGQYLKQY